MSKTIQLRPRVSSAVNIETPLGIITVSCHKDRGLYVVEVFSAPSIRGFTLDGKGGRVLTLNERELAAQP